MKKLISLIALLFPTVFAFAQNNEVSLSDKIDAGFRNYTDWFVQAIFYEIPFTETFRVPWVVIVLIGGAIYFTTYFKLINFREFFTAMKVVRGRYDEMERLEDEENNEAKPSDKVEGEVSHFQALATALSATVGLGNIAGVGVAISIGGPGATFWMILGGLLGMATKFAECTLGVRFREIGKDGTVYGGPMYYLRNGLASIGLKNPGKVLAFIFAVLVTGGAFGIGNMFQANQAALQFTQLFGWESTGSIMWVGLALAAIVGLVIIGGIKRIAKVTEKLVPFMAIMYVLSALTIIAINYHHIIDAFNIIFHGAFTGAGIAGGFTGVMIQGFRRSTFSNEAGIGSAPTAHAAVKTNFPASEGIVALLEPFIDTVIICTMTALVIIITNFDANILVYGQGGVEGVQLTAAAFDSAIPHFSIALTIAVILFAVSTMISWSYYGLQGFMYLFGRGNKTRMTYNLIFCVFIWIGSAISLESIVDISDAMIFAMAVPNIIGIVLLTPVVKRELKRYKNAIRLHEAKQMD